MTTVLDGTMAWICSETELTVQQDVAVCPL